MIALIKAKKVLLEEMLAMTEKQTSVIKDGNTEELERILNEKDLIIEKINEIDLKFNNDKSEEQIEDKELVSLLSGINKILIKIKNIDDINNKELSDAMNSIKGELKEVRQGKRALNNYSNSDPYQSFGSQGGTLFVDQDS